MQFPLNNNLTVICALHNFEDDDKQIFNYTMSFILDELGYKEELIAESDHGN